jgi:hypothetical protein
LWLHRRRNERSRYKDRRRKRRDTRRHAIEVKREREASYSKLEKCGEPWSG